MSDKVSPFAVIKEAVAVSWARKGTLVGISILGVVSSMLMVKAQTFFAEPSVAVALLAFVLMMAIGSFVHAMLNHTVIAHMRGEDRFFPKDMLLTMWRVFVRGLIAYLGMVLPSLIGVVPLIVITVSSGESQEISGALFTVGAICAAIGTLAGLALLVRLAVMVPGAATGRVVKVKEALAMTKGHTLRMVGALVMTFLPILALEAIFVFGLAIATGQSQEGTTSVLYPIFFAVLTAVVSLVAFALLPVWYEKLRLRQETTASVPPAAQDPMR